jgi:hypothetical protein
MVDAWNDTDAANNAQDPPAAQMGGFFASRDANAIGQQLRDKYELPHELTPELSTPLIRKDKEHDPYADIVDTC